MDSSVSMQGFQVLVETEWLDFGHKFGDRCGHQENADDVSEQCPVFLQWLDCVHQLVKQFPCLFEFNEAFLVSPSARFPASSSSPPLCSVSAFNGPHFVSFINQTTHQCIYKAPCVSVKCVLGFGWDLWSSM